MSSMTATRSMVRALVGMIWAIDAARNEVSSSSCYFPLSALDELADVFIRCRNEIEDAVVSLEAAKAAAASSLDANASRRLRVRFHCLKLLAKAWRGRLEEQRWRRCMERCHHGNTARRALSLKRLAAMACRNAEKRVARLLEPPESAAEAAPQVVDDAEGTTALADFRAMAEALLEIESRGDEIEGWEEYQGILRGMERLFSSA